MMTVPTTTTVDRSRIVLRIFLTPSE